MKRLWAIVTRESDETLDDIKNQLRDKVKDLLLEFEDESFSDDDDIISLDDNHSYDM